MHYTHTIPSTFLSRPNRFVALVDMGGQVVSVHVKNTGRCRELLVPGARVILQRSDNPTRKTAYDLIAVWKGDRLINMDAAAPNAVFGEWCRAGGFLSGLTLLRPETVHGDSRFDFYLEAGPRKMFVEVKGVTLERDGAVYFPDAPTERGVKHLRGLTRCVEEGYEAACVFVVQMEGARFFSPNAATHPEFAQALVEARAAGVRVLALDCRVTENSLAIGGKVPVRL